MGDYHVWFRERLGMKIPLPTRPRWKCQYRIVFISVSKYRKTVLHGKNMYKFERYRQMGLLDFNQPFVPSLLVEFHKCLSEDLLSEINGMIIGYNTLDDSTAGGGSQPDADENAETLILVSRLDEKEWHGLDKIAKSPKNKLKGRLLKFSPVAYCRVNSLTERILQICKK